MLACLLACLLAAGSHTWTAARLDDKDILPSHALFNLHPGLPDLELAKEDLCGRDAEVVADGPAPSLALRFVTLLLIAMLKAVGGEAERWRALSQLRVRAPAEHDNVADHGAGCRLERWWGASRVPFAKGRQLEGKAGLQRKMSRGVGGARPRARAGQVMGLVAVPRLGALQRDFFRNWAAWWTIRRCGAPRRTFRTLLGKEQVDRHPKRRASGQVTQFLSFCSTPYCLQFPR
jgi:hypothetical protein